MAKLIEVQNVHACSSSLIVEQGDLVEFWATGGRVVTGAGVECIGIFITAVVGNDGQVRAPMGAPNRVAFLARQAGRAMIEIATGDPFRGSQRIVVTLDVMP